MKKLISAMAVLALLNACTKETGVSETTENLNHEVVSEKDGDLTTEANAVPFKYVEVTSEEATRFLSKKDNDTLYVTNFFATWCPPCMQEIPHFKAKMNEMKGQPVKFTFISLDEKSDWNTKVKDFAEEHGLSNNVLLLDGTTLTPDFFPANFKEWDGGSIPFTLMRKGDKTHETVGMLSEEELTETINSFK